MLHSYSLDIGISSKIHSQDEKFSSYKSLYTLQVNSASKHKFDACARSAVIALIGLAAGTQLFNQSYSPNDLQNLRKNDVAISVGALLLKFCLIITNRCHTSKLPDPEDLDESVDRNCPDHGECSLKSLTKPTNFAVSVTSMMTIIRCFPNVDDCIVSGNKYVMFAIRPIKEGDKLCTSILSVYRNFPAKSERQAIHHEYYNCPCDCPACRGNWTELIRDKTKCNDLINSELKTITGSQISSKFLAITDESKAKSKKFERLDLQTLTKSKELVDKAWKYFRMPSPLIITSTRIMINTFYNVYGVGEKPSDLFRSCKKK
ncbi:hypothetical protein QAD02_001213 [Eretmocerus hayati]|uniref:Uncharacterized protein n=1 Tax=Eretmocerus hayati TaxID=131215 RepID=A0ACC2NFD5_9HYME|nr:hypothetical protein QAD02_001213 [Eretmocerus hayati]